jgi:hypothetical protein
MPSSPLSTVRTGFASARQATRRAWLILAAVALAPAWTAARIVPSFFTVNMPPLSDGAPNLWAIVKVLPWIGDLQLAGLAMAMAIGAAGWIAAHFSACPPRGEALLRAALLVALVLPGLLPQMQPHDFQLAVALSLILALRQREVTIAALVTGGWLVAIFASAALGAAPIMVATLLIARPFLASPANDNGLPLNPVFASPA